MLSKLSSIAEAEHAQVLVSFAGHASVHLGQLLLCPYDWTTYQDGISLQQIYPFVSKTRSCLLVIDSCSAELGSLEHMNVPEKIQILIPTSTKVRDGKLTAEFVKSLRAFTSFLPGRVLFLKIILLRYRNSNVYRL
jgi:hypothetical protein